MYYAVPFITKRLPPFNWEYVLWRYYLGGKGSYVTVNGTRFIVEAVILLDEAPVLRDVHGKYVDVIEDNMGIHC